MSLRKIMSLRGLEGRSNLRKNRVSSVIANEVKQSHEKLADKRFLSENIRRLLRYARNDKRRENMLRLPALPAGRPRRLRLLAMTIGVFLILPLITEAAENTPRIHIVTSDSDIGETKQGPVYDYDIEVKNVGDADLILENVWSGCGCLKLTDPRWPENRSNVTYENSPILKPGESTFIKAKLDTKMVNDTFERLIHIISNDPERKDSVWTVRGSVIGAQTDAVIPASSHVIPAKAGIQDYRHRPRESGDSRLRGNDMESRGNDMESRGNDRGIAPVNADTKVIMFFYVPGCKECKEILNDFLPKVKKKQNSNVVIAKYNIDKMASYEFLLELMNKYDKTKKGAFFNPKPPIIYTEEKLLYGVKEIKTYIN